MSTFTVPISSGQPTKDNHYCNSSSLPGERIVPRIGLDWRDHMLPVWKGLFLTQVCVCLFFKSFWHHTSHPFLRNNPGKENSFSSFWSDRKPRRLWATRDSGTGSWWGKVWRALSGLLESWLNSVSGWGALFELISLSKWKAEITNRCSFQPYVTWRSHLEQGKQNL